MSIKQGIVEEYRVAGHHFTRSIRIAPSGGYCPEVFAIDGHEMTDKQAWLDELQDARRAAADGDAPSCHDKGENLSLPEIGQE